MFGLSETLHIGFQEYIVTLVRPHGIRSLLKLIPWLLFFFVIFLFLFPLFRLGMIGIIVFIICLGLDLFFIIRVLITWYGTCFIITNQRIVTIERTSYFKKNVQEILFSSISEISYQTNGFLQMVFSFGSIKLTFLPPREPYFLQSIGQPDILLDKLSQLISFYKKSNQPIECQPDDQADSFEKKNLLLP